MDDSREFARDLGEHSGRIQSVERRLDALEDKADEMLRLMHEAKGGYKTLMLMAGAAGALGALAGKLLPFLWKP